MAGTTWLPMCRRIRFWLSMWTTPNMMDIAPQWFMSAKGLQHLLNAKLSSSSSQTFNFGYGFACKK